jgi:hypothetical protein
MEADKSCVSLALHLADEERWRKDQRESNKEIFQRLNQIEQCNVQQTLLLENLIAKVDGLSEKTERTYTTYQVGKGAVWLLCGVGSLVLVVAAFFDVVDKLIHFIGKP